MGKSRTKRLGRHSLAISCPNCGAADCVEYRTGCFVCNYCDSSFQSVNPQEVTFIQRTANCHCGQNAIGVCTRCGDSLCEKHRASWGALLGSWQLLKQSYVAGRHEWVAGAERQGGLASCPLQRRPGWLEQTGAGHWVLQVASERQHPWPPPAAVTEPILKKLHVANHDENDFLCLNCIERLFMLLLRPVEGRIQHLVQAGRVCSGCIDDWDTEPGQHILPMGNLATNVCCQCGASLCGAHLFRCKNCNRTWCRRHGGKRHQKRCRHCSRWNFLGRLLK